MPAPNDLSITDDTVVYRAYSRKLDEDGRVQAVDFQQRDNEETLSIALTPDKALDDLDVRGYVPMRVGDIRAVHHGDDRCGVIHKPADLDPDYLEVTGITAESAQGFANSFAARAGIPVERPDHRRRIRMARQ